MIRDLKRLRERIARTKTNRRGYRLYRPELRRDIRNHAASRLAQGTSHKQIAQELGLAGATLLNWCKDSFPEPNPRSEPIGFRPVEVKRKRNDTSDSESGTVRGCDACSGPVVVMPNGVRVEGISLAELPGFLRRLEC